MDITKPGSRSQQAVNGTIQNEAALNIRQLYSIPNDVFEQPIVVTVKKARKQYILIGILRSETMCQYNELKLSLLDNSLTRILFKLKFNKSKK